MPPRFLFALIIICGIINNNNNIRNIVLWQEWMVK